MPSASSFPTDVPAELGRIRDRYDGESQERIYIIEDAHAVAQAQKNISHLIEFLSRSGVSLVATEGASSAIDAQFLKSFPDKKKLKEVMDDYMNRSELAGANAAALFGDSSAVYAGVEDWKLYEEGLALFLRALEERDDRLAIISREKSALDKSKRETYSAELFEFDRAVENFETAQADLSSLLPAAAKVMPPEPGSNLAAVTQALEPSRPAPSLDGEVKRFAEALKKKIPAGDSGSLAAFSSAAQDFRTSKISAEAFYSELKPIAEKIGQNSKLSPAFQLALERHRKISELQGTQLMEELAAYIRSAKEKLFHNEEERRLDAEGRRLYLAAKLAKLELSRSEWEEVQTVDRESWIVNREDLRPTILFYENAQAREKALLNNLLRIKAEKRFANHDPRFTESAILVAGGFHSTGIAKLLRSKNISYTLIQPEIGELPDKLPYLNQMRGELSWKNYFRAEADGRVDLSKAFLRAVRDRLLGDAASRSPLVSEAKENVRQDRDSRPEASDQQRLLKQWRDQIIRDLAQQNRLSETGDYVRLLDEITESEVPLAALPDWAGKLERFLGRLKALSEKKEASQKNISDLLNHSLIGAGAVYSQLATRVRFEGRGLLPLPGNIHESGVQISNTESRSELRKKLDEGSLPRLDPGEQKEKEIPKKAKAPRGLRPMELPIANAAMRDVFLRAAFQLDNPRSQKATVKPDALALIRHFLIQLEYDFEFEKKERSALLKALKTRFNPNGEFKNANPSVLTSEFEKILHNDLHLDTKELKLKRAGHRLDPSPYVIALAGIFRDKDSAPRAEPFMRNIAKGIRINSGAEKNLRLASGSAAYHDRANAAVSSWPKFIAFEGDAANYKKTRRIEESELAGANKLEQEKMKIVMERIMDWASKVQQIPQDAKDKEKDSWGSGIGSEASRDFIKQIPDLIKALTVVILDSPLPLIFEDFAHFGVRPAANGRSRTVIYLPRLFLEDFKMDSEQDKIELTNDILHRLEWAYLYRKLAKEKASDKRMREALNIYTQNHIEDRYSLVSPVRIRSRLVRLLESQWTAEAVSLFPKLMTEYETLHRDYAAVKRKYPGLYDKKTHHDQSRFKLAELFNRSEKLGMKFESLGYEGLAQAFYEARDHLIRLTQKNDSGSLPFNLQYKLVFSLLRRGEIDAYVANLEYFFHAEKLQAAEQFDQSVTQAQVEHVKNFIENNIEFIKRDIKRSLKALLQIHSDDEVMVSKIRDAWIYTLKMIRQLKEEQMLAAETRNAEQLGLDVKKVRARSQTRTRPRYGLVLMGEIRVRTKTGKVLNAELDRILKELAEVIDPEAAADLNKRTVIRIPFGSITRSKTYPLKEKDLNGIEFDRIFKLISKTKPAKVIFNSVRFGADKSGTIVLHGNALKPDYLKRFRAELQKSKASVLYLNNDNAWSILTELTPAAIQRASPASLRKLNIWLEKNKELSPLVIPIKTLDLIYYRNEKIKGSDHSLLSRRLALGKEHKIDPKDLVRDILNAASAVRSELRNGEPEKFLIGPEDFQNERVSGGKVRAANPVNSFKQRVRAQWDSTAFEIRSDVLFLFFAGLFALAGGLHALGFPVAAHFLTFVGLGWLQVVFSIYLREIRRGIRERSLSENHIPEWRKVLNFIEGLEMHLDDFLRTWAPGQEIPPSYMNHVVLLAEKYREWDEILSQYEHYMETGAAESYLKRRYEADKLWGREMVSLLRQIQFRLHRNSLPRGEYDRYYFTEEKLAGLIYHFKDAHALLDEIQKRIDEDLFIHPAQVEDFEPRAAGRSELRDLVLRNDAKDYFNLGRRSQFETLVLRGEADKLSYPLFDILPFASILRSPKTYFPNLKKIIIGQSFARYFDIQPEGVQVERITEEQIENMELPGALVIQAFKFNPKKGQNIISSTGFRLVIRDENHTSWKTANFEGKNEFENEAKAMEYAGFKDLPPQPLVFTNDFFHPDIRKEEAAILEEARSQSGDAAPVVFLNLQHTRGNGKKRVSLENYTELVLRLLQNNIVIINEGHTPDYQRDAEEAYLFFENAVNAAGSSAEEKKKQLAHLVKIGPNNVPRLISALLASNLVVTVNSGVRHLADAMGKPTLVFSSQAWENMYQNKLLHPANQIVITSDYVTGGLDALSKLERSELRSALRVNQDLFSSARELVSLFFGKGQKRPEVIAQDISWIIQTESAEKFDEAVRSEMRERLGMVREMISIPQVTPELQRLALQWLASVIERRVKTKFGVGFDVEDQRALEEALSYGRVKDSIDVALVSQTMHGLNIQGLNLESVAGFSSYRPRHSLNNGKALPVLTAEDLNPARGVFAVRFSGESKEGEPFFDAVAEMARIAAGLLTSSEILSASDLQNAAEIKKLKQALPKFLYEDFKDYRGQGFIGFDPAGHLIVDRAALFQFVTEYLAHTAVSRSA